MPGYLGLFEKRERLEVAVDPESGEHYWVDINPALSQGDVEACERFLFASHQITAVGGEEVQKMEPDVTRYQAEVVARCIVEWNLTDREGRLLPYATVEDRRESVKKLPQALFNLIYSRYMEETQSSQATADAQFPSKARRSNKAR